MIAKGGYTYIMTNAGKTTLYTGVTANLLNRVWQHKSGIGSKFTSKYKCYYLVHFEFYDSIEEAIAREKQIKSWPRKWKENLIRETNPEWNDLWNKIQEML